MLPILCCYGNTIWDLQKQMYWKFIIVRLYIKLKLYIPAQRPHNPRSPQEKTNFCQVTACLLNTLSLEQARLTQPLEFSWIFNNRKRLSSDKAAYSQRIFLHLLGKGKIAGIEITKGPALFKCPHVAPNQHEQYTRTLKRR